MLGDQQDCVNRMSSDRCSLQFLTDNGGQFQIVGAATEKDRPAVAVRTQGSTS